MASVDVGDERSRLWNLVESTIARWRGGETPDAASFLARHPEIGARKSLALDLIHEELCLRREAGDTVVASTFISRFPDYRSSIVKMLEVEQYGESNPNFAEELGENLWPQPGQDFHGFEIVEPLGRGALARVYLARETDMGGRPVVVKVSQHGGHEAHLLGQLEHDNIVAAHSVKNDPETGLTVICMPLLGTATGLDLLDAAFRKSNQVPPTAEIIGQTARRYQPAEVVNPESLHEAFPFDRRTFVEGVAWFGQQLATGLAAAGSHGIVHRDIKPSNVLLAWSGRPMLLDFNLSAGKGQGNDRIGGTVAYMAPERLAMLANDIGPEDELDPRPDIFSLGVLLYELLTGRLPVQPMDAAGTDDASLKRWQEARSQPIAPPSQFNREVDPALDRIVLRCLAVDPAERYQTAADLARPLAMYLAPQARAARWTRRNRRNLLIGGAVSAVAIAAGGTWWATRPPYYEAQYQEGLRLYEAGDYDGAITAFSNSLRAEPQSVKALFARGQSNYWSDNLPAAKLDYQAAADLDQRGLFYFCIGCCDLYNESAHQGFGEALRLNFDQASVLCNIGIGLGSRQKTSNAIANFRQAIKLNPDLQPAHLELATALLNELDPSNRDQLSEAIASADRAVELAPNSRQAVIVAMRLHQMASVTEPESKLLADRYYQRWIELGGQPENLLTDPIINGLFQRNGRLDHLRPDPSKIPPIPPRGVLPPQTADLEKVLS